MKNRIPRLLIALALVAAGPAIAQAKPGGADAAAEMTDAEVRKIDLAASKITLKHGEIKSLDMPPMTMVFHVRDKALLAKVQVGDKLRFKAINDAGKYTVTDIQLQR